MVYRRRVKYYLLKLFRLKDSARSVAGGFACGAVTHFYPTWGLGGLVGMGLARILRVNPMAAAISWAMVMPLWPLFFYLNYLVGDIVLEAQTTQLHALNGLYHIELLHIGKAFVVGSMINGIAGLFLFWWGGSLFFNRYRKYAVILIQKYL